MRQSTIYSCEYCDRQYTDYNECHAHEERCSRNHKNMIDLNIFEGRFSISEMCGQLTRHELKAIKNDSRFYIDANTGNNVIECDNENKFIIKRMGEYIHLKYVTKYCNEEMIEMILSSFEFEIRKELVGYIRFIEEGKRNLRIGKVNI